ncbi:MAG: peptidoglycan-binding protein [Devosiaceae bacterium]|nr:peptidoglycan-binding protein [Devosiaceae bacterium]
MTSATKLNLPVAIGYFIKDIFVSFFALTIKAPLAFAIISTMFIGSSFALTNALFMQVNPHPAPLFTEPALPVISPVSNVILNEKVTPAPQNTLSLQTQIIPPAPKMLSSVAKINYSDVIGLQEKLKSLGFFKEKIDGYYGPNTANAIRAFEKSIGKKSVGALTPELLLLVKNTHIDGVSSTSQGAPINPVILETSIPNVQPQRIQNINPPSSSTQAVPDPLLKIAGNVSSNAHQISHASEIVIDTKMIKQIQLGLASLGFLQGKIDGEIGSKTSKAIRNFEVYYNYKVSGEPSAELVDLLINAGAKVE